MNIVLIGYRGAGKSTVGMRVAKHLKMKFVDTDKLLEERHGYSISDIVKSYGWSHFRSEEKKIIEEILKEDDLIIAPGGGAPLIPENVMALRKNGLVIWLKANQEVLLKRMAKDPRTCAQRPTLTGKGSMEELEEMMVYREPFYERASEVQIDTSTLEVEDVVKNVLAIFNDRRARA